MPTLTDQALCLRRWDFSETSQTVSLFTREHGVLRGLAKGAKRVGGSFSGGFDVVTRGQIVAIVKPSRELATLTEWHLSELFTAVRRRLDANRSGLYMVDLLHHMLTDEDPHPRLFDAAVDALRRLEQPGDEQAAMLALQWSVLHETGYRPELDRDVESGAALPGEAETLAFNPSAGGTVHDTGTPDRWRVRRETIELLRRHATGQLEPLDHADHAEPIRRANRLLAAYLRELMGREPTSMRWAFGDVGSETPERPA